MVQVLKPAVLQGGIIRMRWVYIRVHKYKTHVHRRGEVGSQSETNLQELRERKINTPSERKKERERLTKKDIRTNIARGSPPQI